MNFPKCDVCGTTKKQLFLMNSFFCPRDCDRKPTGQGRTFWGAFSTVSATFKGTVTCYLFDSVQQIVDFLHRHEKNFPKRNRNFLARKVRLAPNALVFPTNFYGEKVDTAEVEIIEEEGSVEISI